MQVREAKFVRAVTRAAQAPEPALPAVVFAGRSNCGKSSLINAVTRRKGLARTSSTPGRTRELVFFEINEKFHFVDLPGYGYAKVSKKERASWGPMIGNFLNRHEPLRLAVLILDIRRDPTDDDLMMIAWCERAGLPYIFALTKADKESKSGVRKRVAKIRAALQLENDDALIPFSAIDGTGNRELLAVIAAALSAPPREPPESPDPPEDDLPGPDDDDESEDEDDLAGDDLGGDDLDGDDLDLLEDFD